MGVASAVVLGLGASFVQSLGLTIQRRSHLQNDVLPEDAQRTEWRRPVWVAGFVIFLAANISGTLFQIESLPVVILAPLGAVSLLYNALLARVLLNDHLTMHMVLGSSLIAIGAMLIAYFGAVPEEHYTLEDLLRLYQRPPFIAFATLYLFIALSVLTMAHLTEWQLVWQTAPPASTAPRKPRRRWHGFGQRRWSTPSLATVAEVSENSSGITTPKQPSSDAHQPQALLNALAEGGTARKDVHGSLPTKPSYGTLSQGRGLAPAPARPHTPDVEAAKPFSALDLPANRPTVVALAVTFGAASGTLSGVCLLLAKSGVDLLVLSLQGHNQLTNPWSWVLVVVLISAALLQLWYLNKALRLADPVLVCPLAFCFYNISSITLGLVYFDQLAHLTWIDVVCVCLGTALLLCGVWVISLQRTAVDQYGHEPGENEHDALLQGAATTPLAGPLFVAAAEEPATLPLAHRGPPGAPRRRPNQRTVSMPVGPFSAAISTGNALNEEPAERPSFYSLLMERGLSIGLSPSSPGFHVAPRRTASAIHTTHVPSGSGPSRRDTHG